MSLLRKPTILTLSICLLLIVNIKSSTAQPFAYRFKATTNRGEGDIYRTNLQTGVSELFLQDAGRVIQIFDNVDATKLYVQGRRYLEVVDLERNNKRKKILQGFKWIHNIFDSPLTNRFFVSIGGEDMSDYQKTIVLDRITYDSLTTIEEFVSSEPPFVSRDESKYFRMVRDSSGIFFDGYQCSNGIKLSVRRRCGNMGPFAFPVGLRSAKNGIGIVAARMTRTGKFMSQQYIVCVPEEGITTGVIPFPWRSQAHLSADARYVIIEQVDFDKSRPNAEYRPGNVYIFDATTGMLRQSLKLPPEGEILVFDNYAGRMYYYVSGTQQSQSIDVTIEAPTDALLGNLISAKHQAESNHWLGNANFVKELDNGLDNAKKHLAKGDSVNCAKELTVFQTKVKGEYDKKSSPGSERFVTEEVYKQLYFNAQYIVDRLPKK